MDPATDPVVEKPTDPNEEIDWNLDKQEDIILKIGRRSIEIHIPPLNDQSIPPESPEKIKAGDILITPQNHSVGPNQPKRDTVPPSREFYLPVLRAVAKRNTSSVKDIEQDIIKHFNLSKQAVKERTRMKNQRKVFSRMRWPVTHFSKAGLIEGDRHNGFSITSAGKSILQQISKEGIKIIDLNYLRANCPAFTEWEEKAYSPLGRKSEEDPKDFGGSAIQGKPYIKSFNEEEKIKFNFHSHLTLLNWIKKAEKKGLVQLEDIEIQIPPETPDPSGISVPVQNPPSEKEQSRQKRWGAIDLLRAQLIAGSVREGFTVTDKGRKLLERVSQEGINFIDSDFLRRNYPDFRDRENHSVPPSREFYLPVLESIAGKIDSEIKQDKRYPKKIDTIEWDLIHHFNLSEKAGRERTRMGNQRKVFNRMWWAVKHLSEADLISGNKRDGFSITPSGKNILQKISREGTKVIDRKYLRVNCPAFRDWERDFYKSYPT